MKLPYVAAAAAKSLQSCPTLCDPKDGSPSGSAVPGILQGRTLEWVAISFSKTTKKTRNLIPRHLTQSALLVGAVNNYFTTTILKKKPISIFSIYYMVWRRKWQPTPVFLPGESQGRGSLAGCRLWGHTESDMTEAI